jgi:phosphoglycerate dehydrogenase-like enzyme
MIRVAFVGPLASSFAQGVRASLSEPCDFVHTDEKNAADALGGADVLVTLVFTREMAAAARRLRLVQVPGAGLDRIDRTALPPAVALSTVHGHEAGIAEYVMGAIIALSRGLVRLDAGLREGRWESQWAPGTPPPTWPELAGRALGIIGYGGIGQAVARRARAFDMSILAIRRDVGRSAHDDLARLGTLEILDDVLRVADHLVITLPLVPETKGLLGASRLALLKPTAILVNVARAPIVDEDALYEALAERRIAGAALDVWYRYPAEPGPVFPARRPFHELPNVLMTPHVAGWTDGMLAARAKLIAENIGRIARGEPPLNRVA